MIRPATPSDAAAIAEIYNYYVEKTVITFEEEPISAGEMEERIREVLETFQWFVAVEAGKVIGYSYANKWKSRCSYRLSVESTVYVHHQHGRKGIGTQLYTPLIAGLRERKMHAVIGGIALPNEGSVALHEKFGFKKVAHFPEVGRKFDRWIDVGYWQLTL